MRVIFLDIDGVLNSSRTAVAYQQLLQHKLDPIAVQILHRIVYTTEAHLVISSTWRLGNDWETLIWGCLREAGWEISYNSFHGLGGTPIIGRTGIGTGTRATRGHEIADWLEEHPEVDDYIILDDDTDMLESQMDRFIRCDHRVGLSFDNFMQIREIWPEVDKIHYGPWEEEPDEPQEYASKIKFTC